MHESHFISFFFITKHCFSKKVVIKNQTAEIGLKEMRNSVCLSIKFMVNSINYG
jgi:hypothetical protein